MVSQPARIAKPLSALFFLPTAAPSQTLRSLPRRTFFSASIPAARPQSTQTTAKARLRAYLFPSNFSRRIRFNSTKPNGQTPKVTENLSSPEPTSLSARLKKLSREYGYSAVGIYFALSALDFPFCFLAVRLLGTDRIGHAEHVVVEAFWKVVRVAFPDAGKKEDEKILDKVAGVGASEDRKKEVVEQEGLFMDDVEEAQKANEGADASIWTQLALAYAIHKSFIFIRVPLTVAVTPKIVKTLRGWGWNVGKKTQKPPSAA